MSRRWFHRGVVAGAGAALLLAGFVPSAMANPATPARYPAAASATIYSGAAFDTCQLPSLSTMTAWWTASPYRAFGVYVGGIDRHCPQPLTASWVASVSVQGWRLIPIYKGLQAPCGDSDHKINPALAGSQGTAAADDAVTQAKSLGMIGGSAVYYDMEGYPTTSASCRTAVLQFLSGWTTEIHRLGYVAGVYSGLTSGGVDLARVYGSTTYARPDALWIARYDHNPGLTGWTGIPDPYWSVHQRAKQYLGGHNETYGGVTLNIDNDQFNAPVATVAHTYSVTGADTVHARSGPGTSYPIVTTYARGTPLPVSCQAPGEKVQITSIWDKLTTGSYVTDLRVSTPSDTGYSKPLPRCTYPYQVTSAGDLSTRSGPGTSYPVRGSLASGALAWVTCQHLGSKVGTTSVWDKLTSGRWVTDYYVSSPNKTGFSKPVPRC